MPRELFDKGVKSEGYSTEGDEWIPRGFLLMHIVVHVVTVVSYQNESFSSK